jgi:hypothetical protein
MNKKFDCVEMKHQGAEQLLKKLSGLTLEQELEFWQKRTEALQKFRQRILAKTEQSKVNLTDQSN